MLKNTFIDNLRTHACCVRSLQRQAFSSCRNLALENLAMPTLIEQGTLSPHARRIRSSVGLSNQHTCIHRAVDITPRAATCRIVRPFPQLYKERERLSTDEA
ncbi:hypothetical protein GY45DRAFT_773062 [Cubamyces sp. BRFM 1775]|nr:hypothetical protein GY45DRAFT_773062 [Cubamyces sp. BRFM 1775]